MRCRRLLLYLRGRGDAALPLGRIAHGLHRVPLRALSTVTEARHVASTHGRARYRSQQGTRRASVRLFRLHLLPLPATSGGETRARQARGRRRSRDSGARASPAGRLNASRGPRAARDTRNTRSPRLHGPAAVALRPVRVQQYAASRRGEPLRDRARLQVPVPLRLLSVPELRLRERRQASRSLPPGDDRRGVPLLLQRGLPPVLRGRLAALGATEKGS